MPRSLQLRDHVIRMFVVTMLLGLLFTTIRVAPARANDGVYSVNVPASSNDYRIFSRGPMLVSSGQILTGVGTFRADDFGALRITVPGNGSSIIGGHVAFSTSTPTSQFQVRIMAGTSLASSVLYDSGASGNFTRSISGTYDWLQVGLRSTGTVSLVRRGMNDVRLTSVSLRLRDTVAPAVTATSPSSSRVFDNASCAPVSVSASDQGSGIDTLSIERTDTSTRVATWTSTKVGSTRPGATSMTHSTCITPLQRSHGDTTYLVRAIDVSGHTRSTTFTIRADHASPLVEGLPTDEESWNTAQPSWHVRVSDSGSGISRLQASVGTEPAAVRLGVDGAAEITAPQLGVGSHVLRITVQDIAGNITTADRSFVVYEDTQPTVTMSSPAGRGDSRPHIRAHAADDITGIDPTTWRVLVDNNQVATRIDHATVESLIETLAPGDHELRVEVNDRAGNRGFTTMTYTVVATDLPSTPNIGGESGTWFVAGARSAVRFGASMAIATYVAIDGRPAIGRTTTLSLNGRVISRAVTNSRGIATLRYRATTPGTLVSRAADITGRTASLRVRIVPRLRARLSTRTARVGATVLLHGNIAPIAARQRVIIQARAGSGWYDIGRSLITRQDGTFTTSVGLNRKGVAWLRIRVAGRAGWLAGTSRGLPIRVR